jgi:cytochrome oxidase Cu insertion factor (SCO1/SenC/PrrC family)
LSKLAVLAAFIGGILVAAAGWAMWPGQTEQRSAAELMDVVMWSKEPIGGPFALVDHNGRPRTDAGFRGKLLLIYFGFTYCSDACPVELQSIATALDALGPMGEALQPLFITVDPEKDTPEQLNAYVGLFHPRLIGLTGSAKEIRRVVNAYKVYAAKSEPLKSADPNIDHSGFTFLVDADGKYVGFFPPGTPAERIVEVIRPQLALLAQRQTH